MLLVGISVYCRAKKATAFFKTSATAVYFLFVTVQQYAVTMCSASSEYFCLLMLEMEMQGVM